MQTQQHNTGSQSVFEHADMVTTEEKAKSLVHGTIQAKSLIKDKKKKFVSL